MGKSSHYVGDIESGTASTSGGLYPNMAENPQLRWAFIRKVYSILTIQLLATVIVAAVFNFVPAIQAFFRVNPDAALGCMVGATILEFIGNLLSRSLVSNYIKEQLDQIRLFSCVKSAFPIDVHAHIRYTYDMDSKVNLGRAGS
jgi:hypothetical protein